MSCSNGHCQVHGGEEMSHQGSCGSCSCCCKQHNQCCQSHQGCCCESHEKGKDDCCAISKHLLCLADMAWMEVVKEKLKEEIKNADGDHIDQLVKIVSSYNRQRWHNKMAKKTQCHDFEEQVKEVLSSKGRDSKNQSTSQYQNPSQSSQMNR